MAMSAKPVLLLLTIHEVVQARKVRQARIIPPIKWGIRLWFMQEVAPHVFHNAILVVEPII